MKNNHRKGRLYSLRWYLL